MSRRQRQTYTYTCPACGYCEHGIEVLFACRKHVHQAANGARTEHTMTITPEETPCTG